MSTPPWPALRATYHLKAAPAEIEARVESLLLEQTVELPRAAVRDPFIQENIVGRLVGTESIGPETYQAVIDYPLAATGDDPAQFLNVLFGNSSLQDNLVLVDFTYPATWEGRAQALPGPQFGTAGLRKRLQVPTRPLTCTALKPVGLSTERLATLAGLFAHAGIDVIKDDHGLANQGFHPFQERVRACQKAVQEANRATGRHAIYVPNLIGTSSVVLDQLKFAQEEGVGGIMLAPMLLGLPLAAEIAASHGKVPILGHPSFSGMGRIAPELLYGKIFPLYGSDAVIFANFGGRFSYQKETCGKLARELQKPSLPGLLPTLPTPAGGIKYHRVAEVLEFYGKDTLLLMGGGLYEAGDDSSLRARAEEFVRHVAEF